MSYFAGIDYDEYHSTIYIIILDDTGNFISKINFSYPNLTEHQKMLFKFISVFSNDCIDYFLVSVKNSYLFDTLKPIVKPLQNVLLYNANNCKFDLHYIFDDTPYYACSCDYENAFIFAILGSFNFYYLLDKKK